MLQVPRAILDKVCFGAPLSSPVVLFLAESLSKCPQCVRRVRRRKCHLLPALVPATLMKLTSWVHLYALNLASFCGPTLQNHDGSIDKAELMNTMRALGAACCEKDLEVIFRVSKRC